MAKEHSSRLIELSILEYEKLKDEQIQRIGFRDNILYVTLVAVGGVISFALGSVKTHSAMLLVPWICIILGWTYIVNDEKISSIGKYIRQKLEKRIQREANLSETVLFGWEMEHRTDKKRFQRKILQCMIDEIAFCLSGIFSVIAYIALDVPSSYMIIVGLVEIFLLLGLGIQLVLYADFEQGR